VKRRAVWALLLSLFGISGVASSEEIRHPAGELHSVQAVFTQEKHLKILARPLISQGTLTFQSPQSLRWEYLQPMHTILLLHDGQIDKRIERNGHFERENGSAVDTMRIVLQDIGSWLDGRFNDNPLFTVHRLNQQTLELRPKDPGMESVIQRIELRLGTQRGVVEQVTIVEGDKDFTLITFSQVVLNEDIPAKRFMAP
jgi:outer membrane lipoprotein-sorting protein